MTPIGLLIMLVTNFMSFFFPAFFAVNPDCNYRQNMQNDVTYYVYNNEYPNYYQGGKTCRWIGIAPSNRKIQLTCNLEMPQSQGCSMDKLLVSTTGSPNLENPHTYCGYGNFTIESQSNNISIGLVTAWNTRGGRFLCTMRTVAASPPQCDCGWKNTRRIVGGVETKVNEFPSMAGLVDFIIRELYCGATIIATRYAVTAAHCVSNKQATSIGLLVGEHNISAGMETNATKLLVISSILLHPLYNPQDPLSRNDIAVVTTSQSIVFSMLVGPACLPFRYYTQTFAGQIGEFLGWGTTEFTGPKSEVLLKTDVDILSPAECAARANGTGDQICTFRAGHDACQSDSGGPLLWLDTSTYREQLVGIISLGLGCASSQPAVNTRITSYLNWIVSVTPGAEYCVK